MSKLIIPEISLFNIINGMIYFIRNDISSHSSNEADSFLYKMLNGLSMGRFNFYEEAKNIFSRPESHPRALTVRLFFDRDRAHTPTIHLNLPSESQADGGVGLDEGYVEAQETQDGVESYYTRDFQSQYDFMITSDNTFEVILIYQIVKILLISYMDSLDFEGIRNPKLSGQNLQLYGEIVPQHVFMRAVSISFFTEVTVPKFDKSDLVNSIQFNQQIG